MEREEKVNFLRIALSLQRISVSGEICDRIIETYEKVLELGSKFSIQDAVDIELKMDRKLKEEKLKNKD